MDYKEKYENALEGIQEILSTGEDSIKMGRLQLRLQGIFPELAGIKDEKIMEGLIEFYTIGAKNNEFTYGMADKDILAWLEKQGRKVSDSRYNILGELIEADDIYQMSMNDAMVQEARAKAIDALSKLGIYDQLGIEKQDEQKPSDNVEPKFKDGDWVVYECGEETMTLQIEKIVAGTYEFTDGSNLNVVDQDTLHLWTIEDAKEGDVLTDNGFPFIFKCTKPSDIKTEIKNPLAVLGYCGIGGAGFTNTTKTGGWGDTANCRYYPATKEQSGLLFAKMKEAGYEFDFGKKELRKIEKLNVIDEGKHEMDYNFTRMMEKETQKVEQKPAEWSEDDISNIQDIDAVLFYDRCLPKDKCAKLRCWLENLKNRVQPKQEWSEKDEEMFGRVNDSLYYYRVKLKDEQGYEAADMVREELSWLKSLRPQNNWKPSDEQIEALEHFVRSLGESGYASPYEQRTKALHSLLEDLKKLKQ